MPVPYNDILSVVLLKLNLFEKIDNTCVINVYILAPTPPPPRHIQHFIELSKSLVASYLSLKSSQRASVQRLIAVLCLSLKNTSKAEKLLPQGNSEESRPKSPFAVLFPNIWVPFQPKQRSREAAVAAEVQLDATGSSSGKLQVVSLAASTIWS